MSRRQLHILPLNKRLIDVPSKKHRLSFQNNDGYYRNIPRDKAMVVLRFTATSDGERKVAHKSAGYSSDFFRVWRQRVGVGDTVCPTPQILPILRRHELSLPGWTTNCQHLKGFLRTYAGPVTIFHLQPRNRARIMAHG